MKDRRELAMEFRATEAGQALLAKGFHVAVHDDGLANFEATRDGQIVTVVAAGEAYGPRMLGEPVEMLLSPLDDINAEPDAGGRYAFASLTELLATLV